MWRPQLSVLAQAIVHSIWYIRLHAPTKRRAKSANVFELDKQAKHRLTGRLTVEDLPMGQIPPNLGGMGTPYRGRTCPIFSRFGHDLSSLDAIQGGRSKDARNRAIWRPRLTFRKSLERRGGL
jgi:hypothetical protein